MELSPTNHDPKVVVTYYMQAVAEYGGLCVYVCVCVYAHGVLHELWLGLSSHSL